MLLVIIAVLVILSWKPTKVPSEVLNPIAWYKLNEGSGNITKDFSGNGNNGIIYGSAIWTTDTPTGKGYALSFDGIDDKVEILDAPILNPSNAITVTLWVKASDLQSTASIIDKDWYNPRIWYNEPFNRFIFQLKDSIEERGFGWSNNSFSLCHNRWCFLVATYSTEDNKVRLYINGQLDQEFTWNGKLLVSRVGIPLRVGWQAAYFKGIISDVRIYSQALSQQEIANIMKA